MNKVRYFLLILSLALAACMQTPQRPSSEHLLKNQRPDSAHLSQQIPRPVTQMPVVPKPTPPVERETFSVVVTDVIYAVDNWLPQTIMTHGGHTYMNLFEGNISPN